MSMKDLFKEHFGCCDNCEPLICCSGYMCGCQGMPYEFEYTEKCGDDCEIKKYHESLTPSKQDKENEMVDEITDDFREAP